MKLIFCYFVKIISFSKLPCAPLKSVIVGWSDEIPTFLPSNVVLNFSALAAMLSIMAKLITIWKPECVKNSDFTLTEKKSSREW